MVQTIIILSLPTIVFAFTTWNILRKNEADEEIVEEQEKIISALTKEIYDSIQ